MCRLINEITKDGLNKYFKYYHGIMPFNYSLTGEASLCEDCRLNHGCGNCGSGHMVLGLLPNNLVSVCHAGFTNLLSDYKENVLKKFETVD